MNRYISFVLLCFTLLLGACSKNELSLSGQFSDSSSRTMRIVYRAASGSGAFLIDNPVPVSQGVFSLKVVTRYPTVLWVLATDGSLLMPIYAEKGDDLTLAGKSEDPYTWQVKGNEVAEAYCSWVKANANVLKTNDSHQINTAVAKAVKANPDSRFAAFLLFTRFVRNGFESEFDTLRKLLKLDEDDLKEIEDATMLSPMPYTRKENAILTDISLPTATDTLYKMSPSASKKTMLYFWRDSFGRVHSEANKLIKELASDTCIQIFNIYMDTDTARWHRSVRTDSVMRHTVSLWALGGEACPVIADMGVPRVPFIIVADSKGKQLYRGTNMDKVRKALK